MTAGWGNFNRRAAEELQEATQELSRIQAQGEGAPVPISQSRAAGNLKLWEQLSDVDRSREITLKTASTAYADGYPPAARDQASLLLAQRACQEGGVSNPDRLAELEPFVADDRPFLLGLSPYQGDAIAATDNPEQARPIEVHVLPDSSSLGDVADRVATDREAAAEAPPGGNSLPRSTG